MRWKKPNPKDRRIRLWFLLFPKTLGGETRWLEWGHWVQEYVEDYDEDEWKTYGFWKDCCWLD